MQDDKALRAKFKVSLSVTAQPLQKKNKNKKTLTDFFSDATALF